VKLLFEKNYKIGKKQIFLSSDTEFVQGWPEGLDFIGKSEKMVS
jgi:hypothetical protein